MIYMPPSTQEGDRRGLSVNATMRPEGDGGGGIEGGRMEKKKKKKG